MDEQKTYCVYKHTSPNNKVYIGITSMNPLRRWSNGHGYKHNQYFSDAINKYGWDNFKHEILFDGLSEEDAARIEQQLVRQYNATDRMCGYNLTSGGEVGKEYTNEVKNKIRESKKNISDETRRKMSESSKRRMTDPKNNPMYGKHHSDEVKRKLSEYRTGLVASENLREKLSDSSTSKRAVVQFDTNGNYLGTFGSIKEACTATGVRTTNIINCCKGKLKTSGSFMWRYKEDVENNGPPEPLTSAIKKVRQFDFYGNFVQEYDSVQEASEKNNINMSAIRASCRSEHRSAGGFLWRYCESTKDVQTVQFVNGRKKAVVHLDEDGNFIKEYECMTDVEKELGIDIATLSGYCHNCSKTKNGERWMFKNDYVYMQWM